MKNVLNFKEISELVCAVPASEWKHTFSGDTEHLEFSMADGDLSLSLQGNNRDKRTGTAPVAVDSVSVQLTYVNTTLTEYERTKQIRDLFYRTRKRVNEYIDGRALTVEEQLNGFGVNHVIVQKILQRKPKWV